MPTGTGKTGIIACLTRLSNQGSSLVLTPWAHLRSQMVNDLEKNFWTRIGVDPQKRGVVPILPTTAKDVVKSRQPQVIVATFTTLNDLRLHQSKIYQALGDAVSLVVVDEGHYEPAVEWGKSVKGLRTKTVLLTATPYRNDLKLFRITNPKDSTHHFTHKRAVAEEIIRDLRCEELASPIDITKLTAAFVEIWNKARGSRALPSKAPRAIICCSGHEDIETTVAGLRKAKVKAIGIHEQFEGRRDTHLRKDVPDPQKTDADVWVHQNKLTEGLDDHRFCCAALFTRIRNDRKLIQQIGRVLRRDAQDRRKPALLLAPAPFSAEREWTAYLEFETELNLLEPQHFRNVVDSLLSAQPSVEYFEGRFRRHFSPKNLDKDAQVIIPPSVLVRVAGNHFSLDQYVEDCTDTLNTEDAVILGPDVNSPCQKSGKHALWVYASVRNARFLQNTSLYEIKLETHCIVVSGGFVFLADSAGNFPIEYLEEETASVPAEQLSRFIDSRFRPTHASVNSSLPYDTVLRGADLHGHNLLSIPTSLTDRIQICRSVRATSKELGRRYVGMNKGRLRKEVTEEDRRSFNVGSFVTWAEGVATILNSTVDRCALFARFMPTCAPPANPKPRAICLDLIRMDLGLTLGDGTECVLKKSGSEIDETTENNELIYSCRFEIEPANNAHTFVTLRIQYQPSKRRFWFHKADGAAVRVDLAQAASPTKSFADFLNHNQDIILVGLEGGEIVYQGRDFYKVDYAYAEQALLDLIKRPQDSPACGSEKGTKQEIAALRKSKATTFPNESLFKAIAEQRITFPFSDDVLICDDLGTESADFVAACFSKRQLALIHAKEGGGRKISASAFHDVVAQAMKNLVYLTRSSEVPDGVGTWWRAAKWNSTSVPRLYRAPNGIPVKAGLWNKIKSDIISTSSPELYVVLVTTGCCDIQALTGAVADPQHRTAEVGQLVHLLDGLNGYARQIGVRLVIYDLPYKQP